MLHCLIGGNMQISHTVAREIAEQLSETIGHKINMMDTSGVIIASSDSTRIGQIHGGAIKLINEGLPYLIVEDDTQFEGARSGVNLPIVFENEVVGTIGITGPVDQVLQYGKIIKRMTEILLLDSQAKEQKIIEQKARERFYDEWILGRLEEKNPTEFERMAASLSIDPNKPVRIAVLSFDTGTHLNENTMTKISRSVRHHIRSSLGGNAFRTATIMVCIMECLDEETIAKSMEVLLTSISGTYGCKCHAGLDNCNAIFHLHENYRLALKAMEIARRRNTLILSYDAFELEFIIDSITSEAKERFIFSLFPHQSKKDIENYLSFAKIYLEENGSLIAISNRLYLHKNTIKYRINKLTEITGVDIRTCRGTYLFTLAVNLV